MNANAIIPGLEYAYTPWPGRNITYYPDAKRVRAMHVYKLEPNGYRQKRQTLVECVRLDNITGEVLTQFHILTVPARRIVCSWDEHLIEQNRHEQEERERTERIRREHAERERLREERQKLRKQREDALRFLVANGVGVSPDNVRIGYDTIVIPRREVEAILDGQDTNEAASQKSLNL